VETDNDFGGTCVVGFEPTAKLLSRCEVDRGHAETNACEFGEGLTTGDHRELFWK
jgi:hypothetical protein